MCEALAGLSGFFFAQSHTKRNFFLKKLSERPSPIVSPQCLTAEYGNCLPIPTITKAFRSNFHLDHVVIVYNRRLVCKVLPSTTPVCGYFSKMTEDFSRTLAVLEECHCSHKNRTVADVASQKPNKKLFSELLCIETKAAQCR